MEATKTYRLGKKALGGIAVALFLAAVAAHIACGWFPKSIDVMPDEMRYLDIARSLLSGDGLVLRGEASTFQKILYPLAIIPGLMASPDPQVQVRAINVLCSAYACSTVFPVLLLARRIFRNPAPIVFSMVAALALPDLMYSMTFMTESLYLPVSLWLVLLCWRCFQSRGNAEVGLSLAAGLACYLVYLCKEVAWMFVISFVAWYLLAAVRGRRSRSQAAMAAGAFLIGFLGPFVAMKLTLFSGMLNSYAQFSFDILQSPYTVLFGLYALATDATYFIVGFGVFPVLYLLCVYRDIPRRYRDLAFFCLLSLGVGLAVVVFTISMREDVGHMALRQHLRYVIPLYLPLLMLFVKQVAHGNPLRLLRNGRRRAAAAGLTMAVCLLVVGFFGSANLSQGFDNSQFHLMRETLDMADDLPQQYFSSWEGAMVDIDPDDGDLLAINPVNWLWRLGVVAFTLGGMHLLFHRRESMRILGGGLICLVLVAFMALNTVYAYNYNLKAYGVEQADVDEICAINAQLAQREATGQVVIVLDDGNTKNNNLVDTYIQDGPGNYRYLTPDQLLRLANVESDADPALPSDPVRYLLVNKKQNVRIVSAGANLVGGQGEKDGRYLLYQLDEGADLKVLVGS